MLIVRINKDSLVKAGDNYNLYQEFGESGRATFFSCCNAQSSTTRKKRKHGQRRLASVVLCSATEVRVRDEEAMLMLCSATEVRV